MSISFGFLGWIAYVFQLIVTKHSSLSEGQGRIQGTNLYSNKIKATFGGFGIIVSLLLFGELFCEKFPLKDALIAGINFAENSSAKSFSF